MSASVAADLTRLGSVLFGIPVRAVTDLREGFILPSGAVDKSDIRPVGAVTGIRGRIDHDFGATHIVIVNRCAEGAGELPSRVVGARHCGPRTATESKRYQLISRAEICFRDAADPLRRVVPRSGQLV